MPWAEDWSKSTPTNLARYVTPDAADVVHLIDRPIDTVQQPDGKRQLVSQLYDALKALNISYDKESYHPNDHVQPIRTPREILVTKKKGTCLDLSVLYCGLCLDFNLLPLLVLTSNHAFVMVSLVRSLREWESFGRHEIYKFDKGLTRDPILLSQLVNDRQYMAIECTGFSHSSTYCVPLKFKDAESKAETLLNVTKDFDCALDIASLQFRWGIPRYSIVDMGLHKAMFEDATNVHSAGVNQAEHPPAYYVIRPRILAELKHTLLIKRPDQEKSPEISIIHGMPGSGKTTVAQALAHDGEVQDEGFPDGILWVTVGQEEHSDHEPKLLPLLLKWWMVLKDENDTGEPSTVEAASACLKVLAKDKRVLTIIDDVWDPADARPFLIGGDTSHAIITTREASVGKVLEKSGYTCTWHDPGVMTEEEALDLLSRRVGHSLETEERQQAKEVADAVGYLPQALELAAAQISSDLSWGQLEKEIRDESTRLEKLDDPVAEGLKRVTDRKRFSLSASFSLSLRRLNDKQRMHFAWLGVLREDADFTVKSAASLWDTSALQAAKNLTFLCDKSLVFKSRNQAAYRLHDLWHDIAFQLLTTESVYKCGGSSLSKVEAHRQILFHYRAKIQNGLWCTLENDGYIEGNITWHMIQAEQSEEIHKLLCEETDQGHNGWFQMQVGSANLPGYLADVSRAAQIAASLSLPPESSKAVGRLFRYALMETSIKRNIANLPIELLVALMRNGRFREGLDYIGRAFKERDRSEHLLASGTYLTEPYLNEAITMAYSFRDTDNKARALVGLTPQIEEWSVRIHAFEEVLRLINALDSLPALARDLLNQLGPHLPDSLQNRHLQVAAAINDARYRAMALGDFAGQEHFSETLRVTALDRAAETISTISDFKDQLEVIQELTPLLGLHLVRETVHWAMNSSLSLRERTDLIVTLARQLPPEEVESIYRELLREAHESPLFSAVILRKLASITTESLADESFNVAKSVKYERIETLRELSRYLPERLVKEAFILAKNFAKNKEDAKLLPDFIPYLPEEEREQGLQNVLEAARESMSSNVQLGKAFLLGFLTKHLPDNELTSSEKIARKLSDDDARFVALLGLAQRQSEDQQIKTLQLLVESYPNAEKAGLAVLHTLGTLVPCLSSDAATLVAPWVWSISNQHYLGWLLGKLAQNISTDLLEEYFIKSASIPRYVPSRVDALLGLSKRVSGPLGRESIREAEETLKAVSDQKDRAWVLSQFAAHQVGKVRLIKLQEIINIAMSTADDEERATILSYLPQRLPKALIEPVLRVANSIETEVNRIYTLTYFTSYLSKEEKEQIALSLSDKIYPESLIENIKPNDNSDYAQSVTETQGILLDGFASFSPALPALKRKEVVKTILARLRKIKDPYARGRALPKLLPLISNGEWSQVVHESLAATQTIESSEYLEYRAEILSKVVPFLKTVCEEALAAIQLLSDEKQAENLSILSEHLPASLLDEALSIASKIEEDMYRAKAFVSLVEPLVKHERVDSLDTLMDACNSISMNEDGFWRGLVIEKLAHISSGLNQGTVLAAARLLPDSAIKALTLEALAERLQGEEQRQTFKEALHVRATRNLWHNVMHLTELAKKFPDELLDEMLTVVSELDDNVSLKNLLKAFAFRLSSSQLNRAIPIFTRKTGHNDEMERDAVFVQLTCAVSDDSLDKALAMVVSIENEDFRCRGLIKLSNRFPLESLIKALEVTKSFKDRDLGTLAQSHLVRALPVVYKCQPQQLSEAFEAAKFEYNWQALTILSAILPMHLVCQGFDTVRSKVTIWDEKEAALRGKALVSLACRVSEYERNEVLKPEVELIIKDLRKEDSTWLTLRPISYITFCQLAPCLSKEMRQDILHAAKSSKTQNYVTEGIIKKIAELDSEQKDSSLVEEPQSELQNELSCDAFDHRLPEGNEDTNSHVLELLDLGESLPIEQACVVWNRIAQELKTAGPELLRSGVTNKILNFVESKDAEISVELVTALGPILPEDLRTKILISGLERALEDMRFLFVNTLWYEELMLRRRERLVQQLAALPQAMLLKYMTEIVSFVARGTRADLLANLRLVTDVVKTLGGDAALFETASAIEDVGRWWP
ncbi:MAG: NB-ARC domain-containing protein [Nitrospirales bacterium]|nr:NB-ARC domain-containing protein [Nitrospirales bacterium]